MAAWFTTAGPGRGTKNSIFPSERFQHRLQRLKLPCAEQRHRVSPETITRIKCPSQIFRAHS